MERVTDCQWDRTLSDGKGDANDIWQWDIWYAGTNIYRILGKSNGMVFGSGIMGYLVRWYEHLPYTWFENGIWQWDMLERTFTIYLVRVVGCRHVHIHDRTKCKH